MEQVFAAFGVDIKLIVVQIINFAVLAVLLSYLLYKPVLKILREREATIAQGVQDAEASAQMRASAEDERKGILQQAHAEAGTVTERAQQHADASAAEILRAAEEKAEQVVQHAHTESERIRSHAREESESEIARLSVLAAERVLKEKS